MGLSAKDFNQQAGVSVLRRTGVAAKEPDPLDQAMEINRKMAANRMIQQSVAQADTEALKAQNERLMAEIENQKLRQATSPEASVAPWQQFLMEQMAQLQGQLQDANQRLSDQSQELLQERLSMVSQELERLRTTGGEPVDPIAQTIATIKNMRELNDLLVPQVESPALPMVEDPTLRAWEIRMRQDDLRWQAEREDRKEEMRAAREAELELRRQELEIKQQHGARMDRFMTDTAPKLLDLGTQLLQRLIGPMPTAAPMAVAEVAPVRASIAPAGVQVAQCAQCGADIHYRMEWKTAGCLECGAVYELQDDGSEAAAPEQSAVEHSEPVAVESARSGNGYRARPVNPDEGASIV